MPTDQDHLLVLIGNDKGAGPSHISQDANSRSSQLPAVPPPQANISPPYVSRDPPSITEHQTLHSVPPVPLEGLKSVQNAYLFWFPLGLLGFHHFYLRNFSLGFSYLTTFGLFGVGWFVDAWRMSKLVADANVEIEAKWIWKYEQRGKERHTDEPEPKFKYDTPKRLSDCYLLGVMAGILGLHHHHLKRTIWGFLYLFTGGLFTVGYLSDWIRMPLHLERYNEKMAKKRAGSSVPGKYHLDEAYVLAIPGGVFGFHNFYLGRYGWGILYLMTGGLFGFGLLMDLVRMNILVDDANLQAKSRLSLLDASVERGTKYQATEDEDDVPRIDPYYSDYNSDYSYSSRGAGEFSAPTTSRHPTGVYPGVTVRQPQTTPGQTHSRSNEESGLGLPLASSTCSSPPPSYTPDPALGSSLDK